MSRVWNRQAPVVLTWLLVVVLGLTLVAPLSVLAQDVDRVQTGDVQPTEPVLEPPAGTETPVATEVPAEETPDTPTETPVPTNEPVATETSERVEQPDASPPVEDDSGLEAAAVTDVSFDQSSYTATIGGTLTVTLTITMDGPTGGGTVSMFAPPFTTISSVVAGSTGIPTCTADAVLPLGIAWSGTFTSADVGTCSYAITLTIDPSAIPGFASLMSAIVQAGAPSGFRIANATIVVTTPSLNTLTISADNPNPLPGDVVTIAVQQPDPAPLPDTGSLQGNIPAGTALVPGSSTVTCSSSCVIPPPPIETATSVSATYQPIFGAVETVTLTYQVTILPGTEGTTITFTGNGTIGLGQPTGPASTSVTVAAPVPPLTANDGTLSVPYAGSGEGTLTADGGLPPYEFGMIVFPSKGTVTIDPATGTFTYTAFPGQTGTDQFEFNVRDSSFPTPLADQGIVTITIGEPDALVATTLTVETMPMAPASGNLIFQVSGGIPPYTFTLATLPTQGTVTLTPGGTFIYFPDADASGTDSFTYTVTDSALVPVSAAATTTGMVNIIITAFPTPSPTLEPGVTPTATSDDGVVGPGDPEGEETPVDPRSTETPDAGDSDGDDDAGAPITKLPSTGAGDSGTSSTLLLMLVTAIGLVATAVLTGKRRTH